MAALRQVLAQFVVQVKGKKDLDDVDNALKRNIAHLQKAEEFRNRILNATNDFQRRVYRRAQANWQFEQKIADAQRRAAENKAAIEEEAQARSKRAWQMGTIAALVGYGFAVKKVIGGIVGMVEEQIQLADQLDHNAERLGVSTDELQGYEFAANVVGVSSQQLAVGLRFFNRAIGEAAYGTKSVTKVFAQLGVTVKDAHGNIKPTDELLGEVADKLANTKSQAERTAIAMRFLGRGGSSLLPFLQKGSKFVQQMFKDVKELGGGFNATFVERAHIYDYNAKRLAMGWRTIKTALATELMPWLEKFQKRGIETAKRLIELSKHTYGFRTALMALAAFIGIVGVGLTTMFLVANPMIALAVGLVVALAAAFVPLYVIFDDFYTFLQGGDSVLGRMLDKLHGDGTALKFWLDLQEAFKDLKVAIFGADSQSKSLFQIFEKLLAENMPGIIQKLGLAMTVTAGAIDLVVTGLTQTWKLAKGIGGLLGSAVYDTEDSFDPMKDFNQGGAESEKRQAAYDKLYKAFYNMGDRPAKPYEPGGSQFSGPLPQGAPLAQQTPMQVTNKVEVHVHGNADKDTARDVANGVKGALKDNAARLRDAHVAVAPGMPSTQ